MKKIQLHLLAALLMGLGTAFAGQAFKSPNTVYYRANPDSMDPDKCIAETECLSTSGSACDFQVFENDNANGCSVPIALKKNTR